jgi:hypothetical protein
MLNSPEDDEEVVLELHRPKDRPLVGPSQRTAAFIGEVSWWLLRSAGEWFERRISDGLLLTIFRAKSNSQ